MTAKKHFHMAALPLDKFDDKLELHRIVAKEMAIVYARFEKDGKHENITHSNEEFFYLIDGHMEAYVGKEKYELKNGDGLLIPPNEPHGFRILKTSIALITFAPPISHERAEEIKKEMKR